MKIKVGSKIFVPSTEAYGTVTKVEGKEEDLTVGIKWENFPNSYDYKYNEARHHWEILVSVEDLDCAHPDLKDYVGFSEVYKYCDDCKIKIYPPKF